jgi:hypothetical protein
MVTWTVTGRVGEGAGDPSFSVVAEDRPRMEGLGVGREPTSDLASLRQPNAGADVAELVETSSSPLRSDAVAGVIAKPRRKKGRKSCLTIIKVVLNARVHHEFLI